MVLADLHVDNIYLITGYTDMRKSVPGLVAIIVQQYQMRPDERSVRGMVILPSLGKDFFTSDSKEFFA